MPKVDDNIVRGDPTLSVPVSGLGEYLLENCRFHGNKIALIDSVSKNETTFGQLTDSAVRLAIALERMGIKEGDFVGVCGDNTTNYPIVVISVLFTGATLAPYNNGYTEGELQHAISLSKPRLIFSALRLRETVNRAVSKLKLPCDVVTIEPDSKTTLTLDRLIQGVAESDIRSYGPARISDPTKSVALVMCSSGTTGLPKGVMLTHQNLLTTIAIFSQAKFLSLENENFTLAMLPPYHLYGLLCLFLFIRQGVATVVIQNFTPESLLKNVQDYKIGSLAVVPPIVAFLAKHPLALKYNLSSIHTIICGAAPMGAELEEAIYERYPNVKIIQQAYGMTESAASALKVPNGEMKRGSVGIVVPSTEIKVIDIETGKALGPNQTGELCYRGPIIMKGYIGNPKATAETIDSEGWLHSGDVGYYDEQKWFFIVDRLKELIKYKGFQVPPAELEAILLTHPAVLDAAVIGIPDENAGELPKAFIVKKSDVTAQEISDFIASRVSNPKRLRGGVEFVESIPKNPSGKILRRVLRSQTNKATSKL